MLRSRGDECAVLDGLLDSARAGRSAVLVLRGEAGIGKTALLEQASESASDFRLLRAVGVESEMELAFAALHQLGAPVDAFVDRLPAPQRDALEVTPRAARELRSDADGITKSRHPAPIAVAIALAGSRHELAAAPTGVKRQRSVNRAGSE